MRLFYTYAAIFVVFIAGVYVFCPKPNLVTFQNYSRAFYAKNGTLLRITLADDERYRIHTSLNEISPFIRNATILYEDQNFYHHPGVDLSALFRALWNTYVIRERRIGGSTITMQVARLRWHLNTTNIPGKIWQIVRALQLTRHYEKDDILEAYFNLVSYGRNIEGIGAASLVYFNKSAEHLSLPEALTLAVIPQNPGRRNPTSAAGINALLKARNPLYRRWLKIHPDNIDQQAFLNMPLSVRPLEELPFLAPHFVNALNTELPWLRRGIIKTTLDIEKQAIAEKLISTYVERRQNEGINNAVALLVNYRSMEIEAMVGSANFFDRSIDGQVNGVTAKRSPGSALKPFIYALAMDQGLIHPMSLLKDAPKRFAGFTPENYDQQFLGPVFARDALIMSRNVPAVFLQSQLSNRSFYQFLQEANVGGLKEEEFYGLALALGGVEVTMEELVSLYAMLANGGKFQALRKFLNQQQQHDAQSKLLSSEASFLVLDILKDNPAPSGESLIGESENHNDLAWKTGTSYSFRDAWAVGLSGKYVLAVWVGNFRGNGNPAFIGRTAAGPLLFELFEALQSKTDWRVVDLININQQNLRKVSVCANTGDLPGRYCPHTKESWFIPGVSPIKVSTVHRAIPIYKDTGLRSCWHAPGNTQLKVYEFWPSDFLKIYQMAGIAIKSPPEFGDGCDMNDKSASGQKPRIKSPQSELIYVLRSDQIGEQRIPLTAVVEGDANELFWFIDGGYVGKVKANKPFFWKPKNGNFSVRVVDDHGRATQGRFKVSLVNIRPTHGKHEIP